MYRRNAIFRQWLLICFLFVIVFFIFDAFGVGESEYSAIRIMHKNSIAGKNVIADISIGGLLEKEGEKFVPILCDMDAKHDYSYVLVSLDVYNLSEKDSKLAISSSQEIALVKGFNKCSFSLPLEGFQDGEYEGKIQVKYTKEEKPAIVDFVMEKISSHGLEMKLREIEKELANVSDLTTSEHQITSVEPSLAKKLMEQAQKEFSEKEWEHLSDTLNTLEEQISSLRVSFLRDVESSVEGDTFESLTLNSEGVFANNKPVSVVGVYLDEPSLDKVKMVIDSSVPLVVFPISLDKLVPLETETSEIPEEIYVLIDTLIENKVYVLIQLIQEQMPAWFYDKYPDSVQDGFINLAVPVVQGILEKGYKKIVDRYGSNAFYLGMSLLVNPRFKFNGDVVRQSFIEWAKVNYPDRQTLNQIWHAHLTTYDEITIWDEVAPSWSYQNKRAYQYDWQNFHRDMISNMLKMVFERIRSYHDHPCPLSVSFPASVFELDETKFTPDRERVIPNLDFISLNACFKSEDGIYAQGYPDPAVDLVWLRSVSQGKPLVIARADLQYREGMTSAEKYNYTQGFLWDMVVSGAQVIALNLGGNLRDEVPIWKAIADSNRLFKRYGEVLRGLQISKPLVRILFSDSSKILDGGVPHLKSARLAFEGSSFAGYDVCFATEREIEAGVLQDTKVLIMPQTLAIEDDVFNMITDYIRSGNYIIRVGTQIPYDPKGKSRRDVVQPTSNTVLVRGMNLPTEYLHGMDAVISNKALPPIPRPVNKVGYPLEGVKSRFIDSSDGGGYLYLLNLRKESVLCRLTGYLQKGVDLVHNESVEFPKMLQPLELLFVKLIPPDYEKVVESNPIPEAKSDKKDKKSR
ncbi:MAG: beta-galactosidase [Candidatus Hydrogenedens sp.]|nr:beta-galactosidase [Candidatus Hydrogenedens sp.]